jgi:hypothetical protein
MSRKSVTLTVTASPETKEQLERLAVMFDCAWGDRPNISLLIERIANGSITIGKQPDLAAAKTAVNNAKKALRKALEELNNG